MFVSNRKAVQFDAHTQASPTHPPQSFLPESFSSPCLSTIPGSSPRLVSEQDGVTTDEEEPLERPMSTPVVSNKMVIGKRRRTTDLTLPDMKIDLNDPLPSVLDPYQLHGQRPLHVNPNDLQEMDLLNQDPGGEWHGIVPYESGDQSLFSVQASPVEPPPATGAATLPHSWGGNQVSDGEANNILLLADTSWASQHDIKHSNSNSTINSTNTDSIPCEPEPTGAKDTVREFPLKDMQEACLLRYYIEEIAHWVSMPVKPRLCNAQLTMHQLDLADESRHFERVVPVLARTQPHLLNAIFAVAARHLFRMPQFKTEDGIRYHSQPLPKLTKHSAVEYMLESIPALRTLEGKGKAYTESVVATAVLLRQLEEIDDDDHDDDDGDYNIPKANFPLPVPAPVPAVNFLNIIDAVLRSEGSQILIGRSELIQASYWMALRQEICYSFTNRKAPQILTAQDLWNGASKVNKAVMHTVQVLKWRYGDSSARTQIEWRKHMDI